jgi:hypothetical protein
MCSNKYEPYGFPLIGYIPIRTTLMTYKDVEMARLDIMSSLGSRQ